MEELIKLEDAWRFLGIKLIDFSDFFEVVIRFSFNLFVLYILVCLIYSPTSRRKDYLFSYLMFGVVVFFICILMLSVKLQLGFALGLFAVFALIRYRTDPIPIREMTYLFIVIGLALINALATKKVSYAELLFTNMAILSTAFALERRWFHGQEFSKVIFYEKIDLIKPEKNAELIKDLKERTGLKIRKVDIGEIDFLRDTAKITIYYLGDNNTSVAPQENEP